VRWRRRQGDGRDGRDDRGTATAELAVVLPAVVLLAAFGVWAVAAAAAQLRCVDAAGTGARALARGETTAAVSRAVADVAPPGAAVSISRTGGLAVV
jgi:Flp pilus assembly protein TadG